MIKPQSGRGTFVIQVLSQQNATWQGIITWTDGNKSQPFRSLLELIKLIDSVLGENSKESYRIEWTGKALPSDT
jgi:hypothetical protein